MQKISSNALYASTILVISLFLVFLVFFFPIRQTDAQSDNTGVHVQLMVENCNHNNICEVNFGENFQGCASDCPLAAPTTTSGSSGRGGKTVLNDDEIVAKALPMANEAMISWVVSFPTKGILKWGLTSDYGLGNVAEINFSTMHEVRLKELSPSTRYFYRIETIDKDNKKYYYHGQFYTLPLTNSTPPSNVTNIKTELRTDINGNYVFFSWDNPLDNDLEKIIAIRSNIFYPNDPAQDIKIYDGVENFFEDHKIGINKDYYYTFFSKDYDGNYSSGSLVHLKLLPYPDPNNRFLITPVGEYGTSSSNTFNISDLEIIQSNKDGYFFKDKPTNNQNIRISAFEPFMVLIDKDKLAPNTKYILFSVEDPTDSSHFNNFFIRSVHDANTFEVELPAFNQVGEYDFFITLLDDNRNVISQIRGTLNAVDEVEKYDTSWLSKVKMWITQIILWLRGLLGRIIGFLS